MNQPILILGAGISALGAAYSLKQKGYVPTLLEKDNTYGGLCGNFKINGFRFDRFVHFSFSNDEKVNELFSLGTSNIYRHIPNPYNLYKGKWIKHPAQNNLYPLADEEKKKIIQDFQNRPTDIDISALNNYEQWLRIQYGNFFAEHFPMVYTKKYWMREAKDLETKWIGNRLYQPSVEEVIQGAYSEKTPITYYAKEMRYPKQGGYKQFLSELAKDQDIRYNQKVVSIDPSQKLITTHTNGQYHYEKVISSLPLPIVVKMIKNIPETILDAANKLHCTCGYLISIGLKNKNIPPYLWWYIYDEDILPARVYSPSLKSPDNVPEGCSSLQLEIYCEKNQYSEEELYNRSVKRFIELGIIKEEDILFTDIRFEPYANVIFDHNIYEARKIVRDYLQSIGIETIGRFGEWDYLWSDQSLLSGLSIHI